MKKTISIVLVLALGLTAEVASAATTNQAPIADAGSSRYAAIDKVQLDGTGSYDPDSSGPSSYAWRQIAGPSVVIIDENTATPTIGMQSGILGRDGLPTIGDFVQTSEIQECEFELVVSDGELTSMPDTVKVIIVPDFGTSTLVQENAPFDRNKPTVIYFGGGNCITGRGSWGSTAWAEKANIISFPNGYSPDSGGVPRTYYKYGDMIIVYLSSVAPDYKQRIQTSGYSTGGQPAIDVAIHLNTTYADPRYAVNRVTFFDATTYCRDYSESITAFLGSSVDGEQCWADAYVITTERPGWSANPPHYEANYPPFYENVLNVWFPTATGGWGQRHILAPNWYRASLTNSDMNKFNDGVIAGAYWSVIGPGKNLQLAWTPDAQTYKFEWYGDSSSGYMDFYDEPNHPGRLPEPVTLVGPVDVGAPNRAILTSEESENAVGYQLLFGSDPYRVMDYNIISDTPTPPDEIITTLPFEKTWWTVRVRDEYGSTIYADPKPIGIVNLSFTIENISTGKKYGYIHDAIDDAVNGDEIVLREGTYYENIDFKGKNITLRSTDPNDPVVVVATVIDGGHQGSVITMSGSQDGGCVLAGLTIIGGTVGVSCRAGSLTIRNCTIESNGPVAIEFWYGCEPIIIDCTILGLVKEVDDPRLVADWRLDETEGDIAYDSAAANDAVVIGGAIWQPDGGMVNGALAFDGTDDYVSTDFVLNPADGPFSAFAWIKEGAPGQVIISQTAGRSWLSTDLSEGKLMTDLRTLGRGGNVPIVSETVITDGNWHRVGFVWDGSDRILYADDVEVAKDTQPGLESSDGGLYLGAGNNLEPGSFFSGLIDDVRIYNRAITP